MIPETTAVGEPDRPVRFGILGAGWFASRRHMPDIVRHPEASLEAVCRRDPAARAALGEHFHLPPERLFADWQEMLASVELDAVVIASPNNLHYEHAKAALQSGLHVLLEKPMTVTAIDAHDLCCVARDSGKQLAVALNPPYWAHCHRIRQALRNPQMGVLENLSMYWSGSAEYAFGKAPRPDNLPGVVPPTMFRSDPAQNGGGYFVDGGSHLISEILWVTGLRALRVSALMDQTPSDMRTGLVMELEGGATVTVNAIGDSKYPKRRVRNVFGCAGGYVTISGFEFLTTVCLLNNEQTTFAEADLLPVTGPVANLVDAIRGRAKIFSTAEHGCQVVEVMEAIYRSAAEGRAVDVARPGNVPA